MAALPPGMGITWLGHSTFILETPNQKRILIDPWLKNNPSCPDAFKSPDSLGHLNLILVTHAHMDHCEDLVEITQANPCPVVGVYELITLLISAGMPAASEDGQTEYAHAAGKGGTVHFEDLDISVTLTQAIHSSGFKGADSSPHDPRLYAGEPCGFIVRIGDFVMYIAGDTCVFGDMALIADLYQPTLAFLPIGDRFTMGSKEAARAAKLLSPHVKTVVPMHFGTFPALTGTREAFEAALEREGISVDVLHLEPGQSSSE